MRNLKKILALVLALVMSLSLMATAGATDFTDADSISDVFQESVDVLNGLKVFQGYEDGAFRPDTPIKRSEVAVIIYRIATGDVEDSQVGIYKDYNKFKDVTGSHWAAGYINYCANAEYIKGVSSTKFEPEEYVTGYQALAMILRAIGYDKNGEFTGRDWHIQTAATARQRGVIENIAEGLLGQAATREMVAEILCKTILVDEVAYTPAFGYQIQEGKTLAYDTFQMEKLTGVVMANEYANLNVGGSSPLADGRTELVTFDGDSYTMEVESGRDDLGESRYVYVVPVSGTTRFTPVTGRTYDTGLNNVYGKDMNEQSGQTASFSTVTGAGVGINSIPDTAEHFINYDQATKWTARMRITYVMTARWTEYTALSMLRDNGGELTPITAIDPNTGAFTYGTTIYEATGSNWNNQFTTDQTYTYQYKKVIPLNNLLSDLDYSNLLTIFTDADRVNNTNWIEGEVYVGTVSGSAVAEDISDTIRWEDFTTAYLATEENREQISGNTIGNTLKVIDNDNDGVADYVLQTLYTVAKIAPDGKNLDLVDQRLTDADRVNNVALNTPIINDGEGELAAGDVVVYALIDGNIRAQKAVTETVKINTVNRAGHTATATGEDGKTWNESAVHTHSNGLTSYVRNMVGNTTYTLYFDLYGNIAAFTEGANGGLVLITNGWYNSTISGAEYAVQAYLDGSLQTVNVTNNGNLFVDRSASAGNNNWGHLRYDFGPKTVGSSTLYTINNEDNAASTGAIHTIVANLDGSILTPVDKTYLYSQNLRMLDMVHNEIPGRDNTARSWGVPYETTYTNAALVNGAAYNTRGDSGAVTGSARTDGDYSGSYEVRALSSTTYYVVYKGIGADTMTNGLNVVVRAYTGYGSVPTIPDQYIEDVYAVGARSNAANANRNGVTYYTAQVVVIEVGNGYTLNASEQVFIPDFAEVTNNIGIENVTMIRGNGEKVTVQVDMTNSYTYDSYNTASNPTTGGSNITIATGERSRLPGLYFMDPSDTNPDVYVIRRMSPAEIRDNDYMVGFVRESYGTLANNYVQVELLNRPENATVTATNGYWTYFGSNSDGITAVATRPTVPVVGSQLMSKAVTENSKLYTCGSTTASLVEAPAHTVLTQDRQDSAGTVASGLNERWDGFDRGVLNQQFPNDNRNEVLVRYDGGSVVWAVSFDEPNGQTIWWNCLPIDEVVPSQEAPSVSFFGEPVDLSNITSTETNPNTTVWYKDALGKTLLTVTAGKEFTLSRKAGTTTWSAMSPEDMANYVPSKGGDLFRLVLDGSVYYLKLEQANSGTSMVNTLLGSDGDSGTVVKEATRQLLDTTENSGNIGVRAYIERFRLTNPSLRGTVTFDIWETGATTSFRVNCSTNDTTGALTVTNPEVIANIDMSEVVAMIATVTAEDGTTGYYTYGTLTGLVTTHTVSIQDTIQYSCSAGSGTATGGSTSVSVINGTAITLTMPNKSGKFFDGATEIGGTYDGTSTTLTWTPTANANITFQESLKVTVTTGSGVTVPSAAATAYVNDSGVATFQITLAAGKKPVAASVPAGVTVAFSEIDAKDRTCTVTVTLDSTVKADQTITINTVAESARDYTVTVVAAGANASKVDLSKVKLTSQTVAEGQDVSFSGIQAASGHSIIIDSVSGVSIAQSGYNYTITVTNVTADMTINVKAIPGMIYGIDKTVPANEITIDTDKVTAAGGKFTENVPLAVSDGVQVISSATENSSGGYDYVSTILLEDESNMKVFRKVTNATTGDKTVVDLNGNPISEQMDRAICEWYYGQAYDGTQGTAKDVLGGTSEYYALFYVVFADGSECFSFVGDGASSNSKTVTYPDGDANSTWTINQGAAINYLKELKAAG